MTMKVSRRRSTALASHGSLLSLDAAVGLPQCADVAVACSLVVRLVRARPYSEQSAHTSRPPSCVLALSRSGSG